jgi:peptidoglycan-N-acetylglucosamine deacetylase
MWTKNYQKAVTFSFDDGITQDVRLVEILNRYGLKATFNINTGLCEPAYNFELDGVVISHLDLETMSKLYDGHEVAVHSFTHPDLTQCTKNDIVEQLEKDIQIIESIFKIKPVGMAYPYGTYNDLVVSVIDDLDLKYGRTIEDNFDTSIQSDLLRFKPTAHFNDPKIHDLIDNFLASNSNQPQVLYIWGHSYECDTHDLWVHFESICAKLANHPNVFYGSNRDVLLE